MANHKRKHRKWYSSCRLCKGEYKWFGGNSKNRIGHKGQQRKAHAECQEVDVVF